MNAIALLECPTRASRARAWYAAHEAEAAQVAERAVECLRLEVETAPKPGLVSRVDAGSHNDMDIGTFHRSTAAIRPFLHELVRAGAQGCAMGRLRAIGLRAEQAMLAATGGINTHRGAIFGLGLLCAAAGVRLGGLCKSATPLGAIVAQRWGRDILLGSVRGHSHGQEVGRRYGAGGASAEAAQGFPMLYAVGVPALHAGMRLAPHDPEAARVHACFALIASLEDTNLLHRGGPEGLHFAQHSARRFLADGGVGQPHWRVRAMDVHRGFVERRLSPGGAADLLAMSLFVQATETRSL